MAAAVRCIHPSIHPSRMAGKERHARKTGRKEAKIAGLACPIGAQDGRSAESARGGDGGCASGCSAFFLVSPSGCKGRAAACGTRRLPRCVQPSSPVIPSRSSCFHSWHHIMSTIITFPQAGMPGSPVCFCVYFSSSCRPPRIKCYPVFDGAHLGTSRLFPFVERARVDRHHGRAKQGKWSSQPNLSARSTKLLY